MENSTHRVEVVPVVLEPHPNADTLSIVRVYGYTVVVKTADWQGIMLAAYLPPDSLAPLFRPEFAWLAASTSTRYGADCVKLPPESTEPKQYVRITARRFRKILSYGLLAPIPDDIYANFCTQVGEDLAGLLGVLHYNPPEPLSTHSEAAPAPNVYSTKYDVASFQRYAKELFVEGEPVIVTEKIHGASGRWVFSGGKIHCGSRTEWKRESESNLWWKALRTTPGMAEWLEQHPDIIVYGEVYGQVQNLKYGTKPGEVRIAVFDLMQNGEWLNLERAFGLAFKLPWVPTIGCFLFDFERMMYLAEGPSKIPGANHFREGIVVKPIAERRCDQIGRVQLKVISPSYLEKE